jgi:hypothetical protein
MVEESHINKQHCEIPTKLTIPNEEEAPNCVAPQLLLLLLVAQIESEFNCKLKSTTIFERNAANEGTSEIMHIRGLIFQVTTKLLRVTTRFLTHPILLDSLRMFL